MPRQLAASRRVGPGCVTASGARLARLLLTAIVLIALIAGCGGGGSGSSGPNTPPPGTPGTPDTGNTFPNRDGTPTADPPPSVQTARVAFSSDSGEQCCVALPAEAVPSGALLVLDDLPAGPATVFVSFFAEDFAPSLEGFEVTCTTDPVDIGEPCDPLRVAAPTFETDSQRVDIVGGGQTNVPDLIIHALPFVFDFTPESGDTVDDPVAFAFKVGDTVTDIEEESVVLEVTLPEVQGQASSFRPITKRIELTLSPCSDGTAEPCSSDGDRDVVGFVAQSAATILLPGPVDVQITALNEGAPPQGVDFRYSFEVAE